MGVQSLSGVRRATMESRVCADGNKQMNIVMRGRIVPSLKITPYEIFLSFKEEKTDSLWRNLEDSTSL